MALTDCLDVLDILPRLKIGVDYYELKAKRQYIARLEELISCPVNLISVGSRREQAIFKTPVM